ncbi:hypothetical protein CCP4SC76_2100001 [Gammaproteobacteria bacterium]
MTNEIFRNPNSHESHQMARLVSPSILTMTSREISELTGKRHDHILRDIRNMLNILDSPSLGSPLDVIETTEPDSQGIHRTLFRLDRKATLLLVSGYDIPLRLRVINRWEELEKKVAEQTLSGIPKTLPEALRLAADLFEQKQALEATVKEQAPKVELYEEYFENGLLAVEVGTVAKAIPMKPSDLRDKLKKIGWLVETGDGWLPAQKIVNRQWMKVLFKRLPNGKIQPYPAFMIEGLKEIRHTLSLGDFFKHVPIGMEIFR